MKARRDVYDTYWKTAHERQEIIFKKINGFNPPFTNDPIFDHYKFCNVYRACDRVSQFLIKDVIYSQTLSSEDTVFRIFLFRLLNKIETWNALEKKLGNISIKDFRFDKYCQALEEIKSKQPIYGNAFILCANKAFGFDQKHKNHLALLEMIFKNEKGLHKLLNSESLRGLFENLKSFPLIGDFMAYQIAIDFNYSEVFNFDENDFTIAGPGAVRGIKKCFVDTNGKSYGYIIKYMVDNQDKEFDRLGLKFNNLFGRKLHSIDCQGWFCETDKYCRVKFPQLTSSRKKIKSVYKPKNEKLNLFFPPKWKLIVNNFL